MSRANTLDKIGISEISVMRLEKGRRAAKSDELEKIATALDVPLLFYAHIYPQLNLCGSITILLNEHRIGMNIIIKFRQVIKSLNFSPGVADAVPPGSD